MDVFRLIDGTVAKRLEQGIRANITGAYRASEDNVGETEDNVRTMGRLNAEIGRLQQSLDANLAQLKEALCYL